MEHRSRSHATQGLCFSRSAFFVGTIMYPVVAMVKAMENTTGNQLMEHYRHSDWWEVSAVSRWVVAMYQRYGRGFVFSTDPDKMPNLYITDPSFFTAEIDLISRYNPAREFILLRPNPGVDFDLAKTNADLAAAAYNVSIYQFSVADAIPWLTIAPIEDYTHPSLHIGPE